MTNVSQERLSEEMLSKHIDLVRSALYIADANYHLSSIVDELRRLQEIEGEYWNLRRLNGTYKLDIEAFKEDIERYRTERDRYKEALETIRDVKYDNLSYDPEDAQCMNDIARKALKGADTQ